MTTIHSILIRFVNLFSRIKLVVVKAPARSFEFLRTRFVRRNSPQQEGNLMNFENLFLIRFAILLFNRIKLAVQNPTKLFRFFRAKHNHLKTEGNPMKIQKLFQAMLAPLLNLKRVVQDRKSVV